MCFKILDVIICDSALELIGDEREWLNNFLAGIISTVKLTL